MQDYTRLQVLETLRDFQYPFVIETMLKKRLNNIKYSEKNKKKSDYDHFSYGRLKRYEMNIACLSDIRNELKKKSKLTLAFSENEDEKEIIKRVRKIKKSRKKEDSKIKAVVSLPKKVSEIRKLANEISIYFSQGYEMYKTSIDMDINSSPIIEYYAFLQIIKAIILLELEVERQEFFGAHGLERKKGNKGNSILQAKTRTHGVFAALLLRICSFSINEDRTKTLTIEKHFDDYYPRFEELIDKQIVYLTIPESFILLWILSEIARYQPKEWREICLGEKNDWITSINEFREKGIPKLFFDLLSYHCN